MPATCIHRSRGAGAKAARSFRTRASSAHRTEVRALRPTQSNMQLMLVLRLLPGAASVTSLRDETCRQEPGGQPQWPPDTGTCGDSERQCLMQYVLLLEIKYTVGKPTNRARDYTVRRKAECPLDHGVAMRFGVSTQGHEGTALRRMNADAKTGKCA
eukprot:6181092-Pleurochrysis_carterae.AAC.1